MTAVIVPPRITSQPHPFAVTANQFGNVAAAQAAGDRAYARAERRGASLPARAVAYHRAYAATMRERGTPMPCPCDLCTGGAQ